MQRCFLCMREFDSSESKCPYCGYEANSSPAYEYALPTGNLIADRYTLGVAVSEDDFGFTYTAHDNIIDKKLTVKEYFPKGSTRKDDSLQIVFPDSVENSDEILKKTVEINTALSEYDYFESVVKIFGCEYANGTVCIIEEYLDGETLGEALARDRQYSFKKTVSLMTPVLYALSGLHRAGIIHGCINPDNIFICKSGRVKLLNIGTGSLLPEALKTGFAPPEQYSLPEDLSEQTDIYSVCAVMYYMLTGNVPADSRQRGTPDDSFVALCGTADIPPRAEDGLMKGMSVAETDRPDDAEQVLAALLDTEEITKLKSAADSPERFTPIVDAKKAENKKGKSHSQKRTLIAVIAIAVTLAVIAAVLAVIIVKNGRDDQDNKNSSQAGTTDIGEETSSTAAIILASEARLKYEGYFLSDEFKDNYQIDFAIDSHDDELFLKLAQLPSDVKNLDLAVSNQYYYDIDQDGTLECIWCTDLNGEQKYVNVYIFDLDADGQVFEGGRITYSSGGNEIMQLCTVIASNTSVNYFLRYTNIAFDDDAPNRRSFELLYYNGQKLICAASAGQNKLSAGADSAGEAYCCTGIVLTQDGTLWNASSPYEVKSLYVYDADRYVETQEDYTVIDESVFDIIWNKNVLAVNSKLLIKSMEIIDTSVYVSTVFPGMQLDGKDIELERRTPSGSEKFLYTCDGRPMQFVKTLERKDFKTPYTVEIYYNSVKYCSCTITLDKNYQPIYTVGEAELAYLPNVTGMRRAEAVSMLQSSGFTNVKTVSGSRPGLFQITNIGKVEKQSVEGGDYVKKDADITLKIYS